MRGATLHHHTATPANHTIAPEALSTKSGLTVLELMVAIFIFSVTSYSLMYGLRGGAQISGRAKTTAAATILASNEAERIRHDALHGIQSPALSYAETVSGITYIVTREIINTPDINPEGKSFTEFEIRVEPQHTLSSPRVFRLVQGYHQ
jgi:type II secretory pathway pseudopilin PulG